MKQFISRRIRKHFEFGFGKYRASEKFGFGYSRVKYVSPGSPRLRWHWSVQFGNRYIWFVKV